MCKFIRIGEHTINTRHIACFTIRRAQVIITMAQCMPSDVADGPELESFRWTGNKARVVGDFLKDVTPCLALPEDPDNVECDQCGQQIDGMWFVVNDTHKGRWLLTLCKECAAKGGYGDGKNSAE